MNSMQPFGYKGTPGTCLWCGRKVRPSRQTTFGHFDVESCATQFGESLARYGVLITPQRLKLLTGVFKLLAVAEEIANDPKVDLVDSERRLRLYSAITNAGGSLAAGVTVKP
jgi:hypothetical protein